MQNQEKICQNCAKSFRIDPEDFVFYEKIKVPPPTWCPECRMIRRMIFRNERFLFRRKDDVSGKEGFSGIPPQAPVKMYEKEYWWSDAWDPMEYGRDYDFSRSFLAQFRGLMCAVPWPSRNVLNLINSDYANNADNLRNCYLCFNTDTAEDSAYVVDTVSQKNCFDITSTTKAERCYDGMAVRECYQTFYSYACIQCRDVWLSRDCVNCSFCFGCINLRNKQYYIFNRPYTKEGYFEELKRLIQGGSYRALEEVKEKAHDIWQGNPYKYMLSWHSVNATGDWNAYCKNIRSCFNVVEVEDSAYCQDVVKGVRDSYDFTVWGDNAERVYEAVSVGLGCHAVKFSSNCWLAVYDMEYCINCHSSSNLFGCVGLRNKSYCIFNTQYSKDDYFALREKIIQHMDEMPYTDRQGRIYRYGEFFPPEFSPFAYNETIAQDFLPLNKEEAEAKGHLWRESEAREHQRTIDAHDLPDRIGDVPNSILKEIIKCISCGKAYRVVEMELDFLRAMLLPLPRKCSECRYLIRFNQRNRPRFYRRICQCAGKKSENSIYSNVDSHFHGENRCPNEFETSYAPERKEIVYCEQCYQAEVI